ncbi:MAG: tetratricopeptide repeat protein, partial [Planctomycetes bacterium]|nr:tetratricopeptide repeat protein [Planctomycetota bacterium]
GLLLFQRFHRVKEQGGGTSAWPSFGLSMAAFALLPFAKEHGLVFPALLTAWVWCFGDPARRKDGLVQTGVAWLLMAGYGVFRATVVRPAGVGELASLEMPGESAFCAVATTLWFYAKCLALPFGLNADPDFELASLGVLGATVGMLVAVAAVVALVWWLRRDNVVGFGVMWLAVTLIPMSNVFFIGTRPLAEERLYLPSIGVCILLGRWVERSAPTLSGLGRGRRGSLKAALQNGNDVGLGGRVGRLGVAVLGLLGCLYAAGTAQRNAVWKDDFSVWRDTVRKSPQMPRAQFHLGLAYADAGRAKQAMGRYEMALRLNAGYVDVRNSLGVTHLAANDLDKAREEFEKVLAGSPAHPRALNNLGAVWLASGTEKRGEAERCFRRAAAARPQFAEARYNLGKMLAEDGKDAEAKREYEAAIAANPDFAKAYNGLGLLAERRGDLAEAERLYLTAATLDARAVEPRNNLAFLCLRQNREPAAAEMFREVLALKPDYEVAHFQLGRICEQAGQAVAALRHYQAAVALKPNYYQAQTNLGIILRILGRREEALAALRAAVQASPAEWQPHCMLGITLEELGQLSEAVEELKTALRLNPSASLASKHLESAQRKLQGQ